MSPETQGLFNETSQKDAESIFEELSGVRTAVDLLEIFKQPGRFDRLTNKEIPEQNISDIVNSISGLEELKTFLLAIKKRSGSFFPNVLGGEKFLTIITERIKQLSLEAISTLI